MFEEKTLWKTFNVIAAIIVTCCVALFLFGKPANNTTSELQADTDRNLGNIKAESAIVGIEVERSKIASDNIKETIGRIDTEIDGSRKTAGEITAGIENLERLIVECERLAGENARIIDEADKAN